MFLVRHVDTSGTEKVYQVSESVVQACDLFSNLSDIGYTEARLSTDVNGSEMDTLIASIGAGTLRHCVNDPYDPTSNTTPYPVTEPNFKWQLREEEKGVYEIIDCLPNDRLYMYNILASYVGARAYMRLGMLIHKSRGLNLPKLARMANDYPWGYVVHDHIIVPNTPPVDWIHK